MALRNIRMNRTFAVKLTIRIVLLLVILAIAAHMLVQGKPTSASNLSWTEEQGRTMGSTYRILFATRMESDGRKSPDEILRSLRAILYETDRSISTWNATSQLSNFNKHRTTDWFAVDKHTVQMVELASEISRIDSRFDVTVAPLSGLWGFNPRLELESESNVGAAGQITAASRIPTPDQIDECLLHIGWRKLESRRDPPALRKQDALLRIDLSALAAGYVADRIAQQLIEEGVANYYIDITGEILLGGRNRAGERWRVGIAEPRPRSAQVHSVLDLTDCGVATSGNYRKFTEIAGERFGHILDPTTGSPCQTKLLSVTVIDSSCARADALSTLLMTMSAEEALSLANQRSWKVVVLVEGSDGQVQALRSDRAP